MIARRGRQPFVDPTLRGPRHHAENIVQRFARAWIAEHRGQTGEHGGQIHAHYPIREHPPKTRRTHRRPGASAEGDRSMFSADVFPAKQAFPPKNGPVPSRPVNGYPDIGHQEHAGQHDPQRNALWGWSRATPRRPPRRRSATGLAIGQREQLGREQQHRQGLRTHGQIRHRHSHRDDAQAAGD